MITSSIGFSNRNNSSFVPLKMHRAISFRYVSIQPFHLFCILIHPRWSSVLNGANLSRCDVFKLWSLFHRSTSTERAGAVTCNIECELSLKTARARDSFNCIVPTVCLWCFSRNCGEIRCALYNGRMKTSLSFNINALHICFLFFAAELAHRGLPLPKWNFSDAFLTH
jgi:hypothetical protein